MKIIVIGGGAAGFFAAIHAAEANPNAQVTILERAANVLGKVKISGGGRCNVCNAEHDPRQLAKGYPRGGKALLGPFHRFCTAETIQFFISRGVQLKAEQDGRVFPITDDSQTIMDCLTDAARNAGVVVQTQANVSDFHPDAEGGWIIHAGDTSLQADKLVVAPGASTKIWEILTSLGHSIEKPAPSLFTFNVLDQRLKELPGIAVEAEVLVPGTKLKETGPVLITHWGLSGPAILRISAWGARELQDREYNFELIVKWVKGRNPEQMFEELGQIKKQNPKKVLCSDQQFALPQRLWRKLCGAAQIPDDLKWADANNGMLRKLSLELVDGRFQVSGKSANKDEFVTCGGVRLSEVNFKTMESKLLPGLFLAGEILDIDAITGGYNFQAAWTTGAIAGQEAAGIQSLHP